MKNEINDEQHDDDDARENAIAILQHMIEQVGAGRVIGLIVGAETEAGMEFFTTYDHRGTITAASLTNHWAITRVLGEQVPGLLQ